MSAHMRDWLREILKMPEAAGIVLDVEQGKKHWKLYGHWQAGRHFLGVISHGGRLVDGSPVRLENYRRSLRRRLRVIRGEVATA